MECPISCAKCNDVFDLDDGFPSEKWFENIIICPDCHKTEAAEIEIDEEVEQLREDMSDAQYTVERAAARLIGLGESVDEASNFVCASVETVQRAYELWFEHYRKNPDEQPSLSDFDDAKEFSVHAQMGLYHFLKLAGEESREKI